MTSALLRINKYLADKGFATRRGADELIKQGKVLVNGKPAEIGQKVSATDRVEIICDSKKSYRYYLYYKPRGIITHSPEKNELDIMTKIFKDHHLSGLFPIGRLDKNSEGLILLTDDGRITERLLHPRFAHEKEYLVTVDKKVTKHFLRQIEGGVNIEGYITKPAKAFPVPHSELQFTIVLTEGKKHQIRRMCAALGYQVQHLIRTRILSLTLTLTKPGNIRELNSFERKEFLQSLGLR